MNSTITYEDIFSYVEEYTMYIALSYMDPKFTKFLDDLIYTKIYKETGGTPDPLSSQKERFYTLNKEPATLGKHESLVHRNLVKYLKDQEANGANVMVEYDSESNTWKEK